MPIKNINFRRDLIYPNLKPIKTYGANYWPFD
jgi:hypothetical protein